MAVSAVPRSRARAPVELATLPPSILVLTLVAPALDLLAFVQPGLILARFGMLAASLAAAALLAVWARYPRTSWLAAATLAAFASLAMRVAGAEVAPGFSLLAVIALGIGGAFAVVAPAPEAPRA